VPGKLFISYTSEDRAWAHWIGVTLRDNGFVPLVHEWEIGAGENIARWMDESLAASDRLLGVFSDACAQALYSSSERWSAYWDDPVGRKGFLVPVEVERVTDWPPLTRALKRLSLVGLSEAQAESALSWNRQNHRPRAHNFQAWAPSPPRGVLSQRIAEVNRSPKSGPLGQRRRTTSTRAW